jgi:hypothetical protein
MGQGFWENGCTIPPFFEASPTLGSVKCSIAHGDSRSHFFPNFIFSKFRVSMDLHIYHCECNRRVNFTKHVKTDKVRGAKSLMSIG